MDKIRLIISLVIASTVSTLPACGSMGGGMRVIDPPILATQPA